MALSLGTINFGVEAETSQLDSELNKSEKKISRFANLGLRNFSKLNNVSTAKINKQLDSTKDKLAKNERQAQRTLNEIKDLENKMNKLKTNIANTSGLNLQYDISQKTSKPMTTTQYSDKLDKLALENAEYNKLLNKQIKLTEKSEEQALTIGKCKERISAMKAEINSASKSNFFKKGFTKVNQQVKTLGQNLKRNVGTTIKMLGSMLLMSVVFGTINKAISSALENNEQLNANFEYMYYALGQVLVPILNIMQNLFFNILSIVGAIAQVFFGANIFAGSLNNYMKKTAEFSKKVKENMNVGDIDEIHNIQDNSDTSSGNENKIAPNINLETSTEGMIGFVENLKNKFDEWKFAILGVAVALGACRIAMMFGASISTVAGIALVFVGLGLIIQGLYDMITGDFNKGLKSFLIGLAVLAVGVLILFGWVPALIVVIVGLIIALVVSIVRYGNEIKAKAEEIFGGIIGWLKQDFRTKFGEIFGGLFNTVFGFLAKIVESCQTHFNGCIDFIQGIFTGNWEQAFEGLKNILIGIFKPIFDILIAPFLFAQDSFNNTIDFIKNKWSDFWDKLKTPKIKLPHFKIEWETDSIRAQALQAIGFQGWPKLGVDWYAKGGSFGSANVIGVGEYIGAKSNPEVVAPQNLIYEASLKANNDANKNGTNETINFVNELKINGKTIAKEIIEDLNHEAVRMGYRPILQKG